MQSSRGARTRGTWTAGVLLLTALTLAGAAGADQRTAFLGPPIRTSADTPKTPKPCSTDPAIFQKNGWRFSTERQEILCGTRGNETFWLQQFPYPRGVADTVYGLQGDDVIKARNGLSDDIWGAAGVDRADLDPLPCDAVKGQSVERVVRRGACKGVKRGRLRLAAEAVEYPHRLGTLECQHDSSGRQQIRFIEEPTMRAVDSTPQVDWQFVAWRAVLNKKQGDEWAFVENNDWLWDRTYDEQVQAFPGNFWRRLDTNQRWFVWFYPSGPGEFRIALKFHWYGTPTTPAHDLFVWAGNHYGNYENGRHESCAYPPTGRVPAASSPLQGLHRG
jgi:hypothetical protein